MRRIIAGALCAFALVAGVAGPARADVTGVVRGVVTAAGVPRAGVTVTAQGEGVTTTAVTDARGTYTFARLPFGHYTVSAHAGTGLDAERGVDVTSDSVADVPLALGSTRTIGATQANGHGVGGYPVSVTTLSNTQIQAAPQNQNLNRLLDTLPGIVRYSYDEPVVHGFHGISYEIDGAPIPQTTSTSFSQIFDPRNIDSLEVFTGAFPAEFGGQRMGALVNIVSKRDIDLPSGSETVITPGFGSYANLQGNLAQANRIGNTDLFVNVNAQNNARGLDTPSATVVHDSASLSDEFIRSITRFGPQTTLAINLSNQYNTYQIPINLTPTSTDTIVNLPGQDDVQREYSSFASVNFTQVSRDGSASWQVIPWWRSSRIVYAGDLVSAVQALDYSADNCAPNAPPCTLAGLSQDRKASVVGLRTNYAHSFGAHALKFGIDRSVETFTSAETIVQAGAAPFYDNAAQHGTTFGAYLQDTWTPNRLVSLAAGVRYDFSNGFTQGNLVQPRVGFNVRVAPNTVVHAYYGRLYAAPALEDTRRDAVVIGGGDPNALPVYDLKPQTESYYEAGVGQTFGGSLYASLNAWQRNVWNVLDTTQLYPTPISATYNNALGLAHGLELRVQQHTAHNDWYVSGAYSQAVAGGISGGTFLFPPDAVSDSSLQPEDHDQALAINEAYTQRFGHDARWYATFGSEYGTGYPVQFQNGSGRLTPHLTFDATFGRTPSPGSLGFRISALNLGNYQYVIKVNNGFNTTQYAPGLQLLCEAQLAF